MSPRPAAPGALDGVAAVVFDLDGTLVDSRVDIATAADTLRSELGLEPLGVDRVATMVGEGARTLVERVLADERDVPPIEVTLARFLELYGPICTATTRAYPGIDACVAALAARFPLAMLTNKPLAMSEAIVASCGWSGRFAPLVGGDSLPVRKPDPEPLRHVARELGVAVESVLLVGDSAIDARTAVAAGARLALVPWGYAKPGELDAFTPDLWMRTADDLAAALGVAAAP